MTGVSIISAELFDTLEAMRRVLLHSHVRGVRILTYLRREYETPNGVAFQNFVFNLETWSSILNRGKPGNCRMAISHCFGEAASFPGCPQNNKSSCISSLASPALSTPTPRPSCEILCRGSIIIFGPSSAILFYSLLRNPVG